MMHRKDNLCKHLLFLGLYWIGVVILCSLLGGKQAQYRNDLYHQPAQLSGRHLLQDGNEDLNCTPSSLEEFPPDFMTQEQRQNGGVIFHIFIALYIFVALAIVCDDYFVSSLERICTALKLQPDVAGATFMAVGSSAPEIFTSIIGVFFAKSDVGVGTIVGSAVFNLLFSIALCALFSGMVIHLTWWPMVRDLVVYTISIAVLIGVMVDSRIHWYEATIMVFLYILYCLIMYFNQSLGDFTMGKVEVLKQKLQNSNTSAEYDCEQAPLISDRESDGKLKYDTDQAQDLNGSSLATTNIDTNEKEISFNNSYNSYTQERDISCENAQLSLSYEEKKEIFQNSLISQSSLLLSHNLQNPDGEFESPLLFPKSTGKRIWWIFTLPITVLLIITIPDSRRPGCWRNMYALTFIISILWIAGMTYVMVWMVTIAGYTMGIPDTVMGLTFLAAGTSVPDAMASLFVARDGFGDMAVSNSIGSNVFDILLGLGLPWLIQTGIASPGSVVTINSTGLTVSGIILLLTVLILTVAIICNKWKLTKGLGGFLLVMYVLVTVTSCLFEAGVFGDRTILPPCVG